MGIHLGKRHSISVGGSAGRRWEWYWMNRGLNYNSKTRSGLNLMDSFGNNTPILPAYLYKPLGTEYYYCQDNGALDIGNSDFTIAGWVKGEGKTASVEFLGKGVGASVNGRYAFYSLITSGYIGFEWQTSSGLLQSIASTIDITSGWHFVLSDINQTTKKVRLFIDNIQIGSDTSFNGSFPAMNNIYEFLIGANNANGGAGITGASKTSHSDSYIYKRLLTPEEKTLLFNRGYVDIPTAYWPLCGGSYCNIDVSGNSYHLTGVNITSLPNTKFSSVGSSYALDNGFALYSNGYDNVYVPFSVNGNEIIPTLPAGYKKSFEGNHNGDITRHNLANSILAFSGSTFDRSDTNIYNDKARALSTYYDSTNLNTKKYWHVSECNNIMAQSWLNTDYKGILAFKIKDHSYMSKKYIDNILSFNNMLSSSDQNKLYVSYCGDYIFTDTYEDDYIQWKYTIDQILTTNGTKILKWLNADTDVFYLSIDGGLTYPYSINSPINGESPKFAHILNNGNILIGMNLKIYLSTDNLTSLSEIIISGFTATPDVYFAARAIEETTIEGNSLLVWGTYSTNSLTEYININVFYTVDSGAHIKIAYTAGVTNPPNLTARHIHGTSFNSIDNSFWIFTGDHNAGKSSDCNIIKGTYDFNTDTWIWEKMAGDTVGTYKIVSLEFYNNGLNVLMGDDDTDAGAIHGLYISSVANIGNKNNWVNIYQTLVESPVCMMNGNDMIGSICHLANSNVVISSKTGIPGIVPSKIYGVPDNFLLLLKTRKDNVNGWYLNSIKLSGQQNIEELNNGALWIKIK